MKTYRLTYACPEARSTFTVTVEAEDRGRAEVQGRFAVNEAHSPKKGAVSLRGFAGQLAFNGRYELATIEELG